MAPDPAHANPLKARLDAGSPAVGALLSMPSVNMAQVLCGAGFDWLFIDMEHGPIGIESMHGMVSATRGTATAPIVRVPWNLHWLVKPVLDAGAMGIIFPTIRTADEAREAAASVRYPPVGNRGFGPFYSSLRFGTTMLEYPEHADREVLCVLLIEHKDAIDNIQSIVEVPGIDVCIIAPFDLALSYGHRDVTHPQVLDAVARAEEVLGPAPIHLGGLATDPEAANAKIDKGYRMLIGAIDTELVRGAAGTLLSAIKR